jgi:hypothetical protein
MRWAVLGFILCLALSAAGAAAIENNQYFTMSPNETMGCVYVNLPQDMGVASVNSSTVSIVETNSPWVKMSYSKITVDPGVLIKVPICFYPPKRTEGEYSYYSIKIYSPFTGIYEESKGGFCVSSHGDVDSGVDATNTTDICNLMNDNSDIFDVQFKEDVVYAEPGQSVVNTVYLTSYAEVRVSARIETAVQNDFSPLNLSLSSDHPLAAKRITFKAPSKEGNYTVRIIGEINNCRSCHKEAASRIVVKSGAGRSGFTASVVPNNINIKSGASTTFRVVITNYDAKTAFAVKAEGFPNTVKISPPNTSVMVDSEEENTIKFYVTPPADSEDTYRLEFTVRSDGGQRLLEAYLSVGELFTDALREIAQDKNEVKSTQFNDEADDIFSNWKSEYDDTGYGDDLGSYDEFKNDINASKSRYTNKTKPGTTGPGNGSGERQPVPVVGIDWTLVIIPVIIVIAVLVFILYRKSRVVDEFQYPSPESRNY